MAFTSVVCTSESWGWPGRSWEPGSPPGRPPGSPQWVAGIHVLESSSPTTSRAHEQEIKWDVEKLGLGQAF